MLIWKMWNHFSATGRTPVSYTHLDVYKRQVKESRGRLSYLTPDRTKPITARKLGDDFDKAAVLALLTQNANRAAEQTKAIPEYPAAAKKPSQGEKTAKTTPADNTLPVSYTHLDVYKRQAQDIPGEIAVIRLVPARKDWNDVLRQQGDIPSRKFIAETITLRELPTAQPVPMLRMADVELTSVEWLWFPYIPFGKLTIIQGNPCLLYTSAVHQPDREDGGIPNPHFHVLCPIRPIKQDGKWGLKQRRVYELDEDGNRIRDANGRYVFNAVPTTDWGSPETLEHWRQTWAELCNAKFAEKGIDVRIDHRSYERQGVDLLPTVHEGATVRAMEKKGIRTEKGEFNRWIKATNAVIRDIKKKIALLFDWIAEAKAELAKPQAPDLVSLLNAYYTSRRAGAYSQKGKVSNLKEMNETFNYLRANGIYSLEDLESRVSEHSAATVSYTHLGIDL